MNMYSGSIGPAAVRVDSRINSTSAQENQASVVSAMDDIGNRIAKLSSDIENASIRAGALCERFWGPNPEKAEETNQPQPPGVVPALSVILDVAFKRVNDLHQKLQALERL
jgi:hypothetical protein